MSDPERWFSTPPGCLGWWTRRRWFWLWLPGCRVLNVHSNHDCHRLSFQIGPLGFRWTW